MQCRLTPTPTRPPRTPFKAAYSTHPDSVYRLLQGHDLVLRVGTGVVSTQQTAQSLTVPAVYVHKSVMSQATLLLRFGITPRLHQLVL